jgi:carbon storage regulator
MAKPICFRRGRRDKRPLKEVNTMLVLSRKIGETIVVGDDITITVQRIAGNRVAIGVQAPDQVRILRGELEPYARAFEEASEETSAVDPPAAASTLPPAPFRVVRHVG